MRRASCLSRVLQQRQKTRPERAKILDLVAELDGVVVGAGVGGLQIDTTTEGAGWAFVTVDADRRRLGVGDALGRGLDHLRAVSATSATSFIRWSGPGATRFTGTVRDHRGRRLATAAKRRVAVAAARGVRRVTTSNAEENAAMRAINRRLGFEPIGEVVILGRDLQSPPSRRAKARPNGRTGRPRSRPSCGRVELVPHPPAQPRDDERRLKTTAWGLVLGSRRAGGNRAQGFR